ncbi:MULTISPECIES: DapH/DapD/GlmU-related protein [unclassified Mesorhizobium]|uniref:DapH/DapD/GlmU-related protein n=1 Tax=unclassified Mesorhizobium TaxID=325217 RepID=UPI0003CEC374|nr:MULTISPECIES: DapH/DapD/GlmU-related protein [unclassified Mesorhizobium]ESW68848.1 antibiotic acetyltransferase [Mesorhizobium sp. LSJC277A00]ESX60890.1 antibiotic acetyltransferase [Mesorhizobium sp. LSHC422A00]
MDRTENLVLKDPEPRIHPTAELKACKLGRYASIGERVVLREVNVGDFSYFERHAEAIYTTIGKFCSIAANSRINALEHPIERITQHKLSYRPNEYFRWLGVDAAFRARRQAKAVGIGNDVWIGHGAVIMPGISIGNGAIVGANAVVTRDVPAYAIVAGVPAKPLRMRFPSEIAARIESLAWWDWPPEKLAKAVPDMQALPIEDFLDRWEQEHS